MPLPVATRGGGEEQATGTRGCTWISTVETRIGGNFDDSVETGVFARTRRADDVTAWDGVNRAKC